jgi:CPA1 family monovalent cation:H+ antiporter
MRTAGFNPAQRLRNVALEWASNSAGKWQLTNSMTIFQIIALLITLTALFSYLNFRFIKLPTSIGVMLIALLGSLLLIALEHFHVGIEPVAAQLLQRVDFDDTLLQGLLSFLLFAGALHINLNDLAAQKWVVTALAVFGVLISTLVFGTAMFFVLSNLGLRLSYAWCLLFGALISPTDPIAVLGILTSARVPKSLEIQIAGESLFNDGIGVVAFLILREIALSGQRLAPGHVSSLFLEEAVGGAALGLALGWLTYRLLKSVDNYQVEVLLTLALVVGGCALASALNTSGPIAIVVAGLLIGNHGRRLAMSETTRQHLDMFWELLDEILNAVLFVLIGLEVLVLSFSRDLLISGLIAVPTILFARWVSVAAPLAAMRPWQKFTNGTLAIMTWGGLRGGISVALALSLPNSREREAVVAITYIIVIFSILIQGLTIKRVVERVMGRAV